MANYKLKDQFKYQRNFKIYLDGQHITISKSDLQNNSEDWIKKGLGHYFEIDRKKAIKLASTRTSTIRDAAKLKEKAEQEALTKERDANLLLAKEIDSLRTQLQSEKKRKEEATKLLEAEKKKSATSKKTEEKPTTK